MDLFNMVADSQISMIIIWDITVVYSAWKKVFVIELGCFCLINKSLTGLWSVFMFYELLTLLKDSRGLNNSTGALLETTNFTISKNTVSRPGKTKLSSGFLSYPVFFTVYFV